MASRIGILLIVLLVIPGLIARNGFFVEHEHDGGADAHDHHALAGHVQHAHRHSHHHAHGHAHHHSRPHRSEAPDDGATNEESPGDEGTPDDGDRHGHYQAVDTVAVRRTAASDDAARLASVAHEQLSPALEPSIVESFGRPPSLRDRRGHPPSRAGRTTSRLIQGIGLLL